ncbi:DUF4922 domain-containing protein [Natronogracilivirga saccharolytica]|uniref:DUF4922 domain-containing protein n=1 Tax=Natronogracilivirga saccharolytica TaxID=2812953 RepID=A0A8J7UU49_9BACT|nr:DUF4922 domain-containing protein [Natronogracilivirga saccharolytica]MBP3193251.1 DUF4922 domain-containing protein [Natronogracilivirga saccharolytica]
MSSNDSKPASTDAPAGQAVPSGRTLSKSEMSEFLDNRASGVPDNPADQARLLLRHQRRNWPMLAKGAESLDSVQVREFAFDGFGMKVQFNPGRIVSSSAKVDKKSIKERKCFLCQKNLPPEQKGLMHGDYMILGNPFPIFNEHFTIPHIQHIPQLIKDAFDPMLRLTEALGDYYTLFYNGPRCGASAPDHLHFQGGEYGFMPIDSTWQELAAQHGRWVVDEDRFRMACVDDGLRRYLIMDSDDRKQLLTWFNRVYQAFDSVSRQAGSEALDDEEPMLNILTARENNRWRVIAFLRKKHRPGRYFAEGDEKMVFSPASVDFGGMCITPVERDFQRITADDLKSMFNEVSATPEVLDRVTENAVG